MGKVLVIGCGGVASVAIHKCVQNHEVFQEICIASRTKSKCDKLKEVLEKQYGNVCKITTAQVDANSVEQLVKLMKEVKARVRSDIDFEMRQKYNDEIQLEKDRIAAARAVGVAFGNGQKPTTTNLMWLR